MSCWQHLNQMKVVLEQYGDGAGSAIGGLGEDNPNIFVVVNL